jgi:GT2 family glycosyltransferase
MRRISVIVLNWNGERFLEVCLEALLRQTWGNYEIILVDNGSKDSSVRLARANFPEVTIVQLDDNKGFTGGNAAGLRLATGEYVALVNNDTRADPGWLENLVQPMLEDPRIGICASRLLIEGDGRIYSAGDGITTAAVGFNRGLWQPPSFYMQPEAVFSACAGAVIYRRRMLNDIGFFDNDFFIYDEDSDLSFRAQLAGWKCVYVPSAVIYHVGSATTVRLSDFHVYYHTRNLEFVWIKDMPTSLMLRFAHHKLIQELGSFAYLCLRHMKWRAFFRAKRDALKMLPMMLEKRKRIQARRRVSNHHIRRLLTSYFSAAMIRKKIVQFVNG